MSQFNGPGSTALLRCPACNAKVVVQRANGEIAILQRAIIVRNGQVFGLCAQCKIEVPIETLSFESRCVFVSESQSQSGGLTLRQEEPIIQTETHPKP